MSQLFQKILPAPAIIVVALVCQFISGCQPIPGGVEAQPASSPSQLEQAPYYQQILTRLQSDKTVLPYRPPVHPVNAMYNREAVIPPQCYTRTEEKFNPCYVCHQDAIKGRENIMNDGELQKAYSFSDVGLTNHWRNLFEDRSNRINAIDDKAILAWVNSDNYTALKQRLASAGVKGWIPDLNNLHLAGEAFDPQGFALDGSLWVAFNYKPMPSTFWPTNGSTDDVMIRLPPAFRENSQGVYSADIYKANLAILEANIKGLDRISSLPVDEALIGVNLDDNPALQVIDKITKTNNYVGRAHGFWMERHIYPPNTEFLHTVRYLGIAENGTIVPSKRMKEVRYMRKYFYLPKLRLHQSYREESFEKEEGYLPGYINRNDGGLDNEMGWFIKGYIEDKHGDLRFNTYEENFFCMGCHTSVGSTIDKTFSFPRKVDGAAGWGYIDLKGMPDAPNKGESVGEIATYLERTGGGSEFRNNTEMAQRWYRPDGRVDVDKVSKADVYTLITPSKERAMMLNKAYRVLVDDQDFIFGRDATVTPPENVFDEIDNDSAPTLPDDFVYSWDIRLDWGN